MIVKGGHERCPLRDAGRLLWLFELVDTTAVESDLDRVVALLVDIAESQA